MGLAWSGGWEEYALHAPHVNSRSTRGEGRLHGSANSLDHSHGNDSSALHTALHSCFCRKERGQALTGSRISRPELSGRDFNQIPGSWDFLGQDLIIFLSHDFIIAPFSFGFFSYCCIIAFFFVGWFHISLLGRCINFSIVHNEKNQRSTKTLHYYTKKQRWLKDIRYKVTFVLLK